MASLQPPACEFGLAAPDFYLPATDGTHYHLHDLRGANGTVVMFICNHCPYVKAIIDRIVADMRQLKQHGVNAIAINANDASSYPEDSFANMQKMQKIWQMDFAYLHDESQNTARAYNAVCTPDFFGFDGDLKLQYRGRLDASRREAAPADVKRELLLAMLEVAKTGTTQQEQIASIGCSIKWRD